jgi:hypothetical protein
LAYHTTYGSGSASAGSGQAPAQEDSPTSDDSPTPEDTYSDSPSPSPSPTARDPYTLDDESTDDTPLEVDQFFPDDVDTYERVASGEYSGCSDSGGDATQSLMSKHGCGRMETADYLDTDNRLMASVMVIPLSTAADADAVESSLGADHSEAFNQLSFFCPNTGAGSDLCGSGPDPQWWAWYSAYHRYVLVAVILRLDGADTAKNSASSSLATSVMGGIKDHMLMIE